MLWIYQRQKVVRIKDNPSLDEIYISESLEKRQRIIKTSQYYRVLKNFILIMKAI